MKNKLPSPQIIDPSKEALHAILRNDFESFLLKFLPLVVGKKKIRKGKLLALFAEIGRVMEEGDEKRVIVNTPPRSSKSTVFSVCFVAWLLGRNPTLEIAVVCHSKTLGKKFARQCLKLMQSDEYKAVFPGTIIPEKSASVEYFQTTKGGSRIAVTTRTGFTGHGADVLITDDPLDAKKVNSDSYREKVNEDFPGGFLTRLNDPQKGLVLLLMQRLHARDLTGYLEERFDSFKKVALPLIAEENQAVEFHGFRWNLRKGDLTDPDLWTLDEVEERKKALGLPVFKTQMQQNPPPPGAGWIKQRHFPTYTNIPARCKDTVFSIDMAGEGDEGTSYSVCQVWQTDGIDHYLLDSYRLQLDFVAVKNRIKNLLIRYQPTAILIENAHLGESLIGVLKDEGVKNIFPVKRPTSSKKSRLAVHLATIEQGYIHLPQRANWLDEFLDEFLLFPFGKYWDQIDAMSQFLDWIKDPNRRRHEPALARSKGPVKLANGRYYSAKEKLRKPHPLRDPKNPRARRF